MRGSDLQSFPGPSPVAPFCHIGHGSLEGVPGFGVQSCRLLGLGFKKASCKTWRRRFPSKFLLSLAILEVAITWPYLPS